MLARLLMSWWLCAPNESRPWLVTLGPLALPSYASILVCFLLSPTEYASHRCDLDPLPPSLSAVLHLVFNFLAQIGALHTP